ncbi:MAG: glycosyl hydrolase family 30 [Bacteroidales bacterium]|nr:glycosyl hydrolase family 30 [Candidatus Sodaliphilus aphodohippi]
MKTRHILTIAVCLISLTTEAQKVEWRTSTQGNYWQAQKNARLTQSPEAGFDVVKVTGNRAQTLEGLGGCFNELGWDVLCKVSEQQRNDVINKLFGKDEANFSYCRMPIGSSDFAMNYYSLNDVADDYDMINFNINRDRYILLKYIKAAQQVRPDLKIWASPWTPPAWMKTNNHYASTYDNDTPNHNGLTRDKEQELDRTGLKMERGVLRAYALYFSKFVQAYANEGVDIKAICVQNEPCSPTKYSSCPWRPEDLAYFVGNFMGPQFEKDGIKTEIFLGTCNRDNPAWSRTALDDPKAKKYWAGEGFQWDGWKALPYIYKEYPNLKMMHTEAECGNGSNDWGAAEHTWWQMNHYLRNGVVVFSYWNMVLSAGNVSPWGWKQNALISVDPDKQTVTYNPEFYLMKHLCHWINPGAARLATDTDRDDMLAFVNADGSRVVVMVNKTGDERKIAVEVDGKYINASLQPHSFHTIFIK